MTITFDTLTGARGKAVLDDLLHRRPAGIIVLAHAGSDLTNVGSYFNTQEIPYLLLDPLEASSRNLDAILIDRQQGVYEAIHYLARQGRRRIAYLGQAHSITRLAGYYRALAELGISPLLIEVDDRDDEQFSAARAAARRFAELSPRPDAVQAYSDVTALGFIAGLHDLGIAVPDDVAVIGFDDRRMAEVSWPLLTTVAQPSREVGVLAGKILLKKIAGEIAPPEGWTQTLPTRLVVRESA